MKDLETRCIDALKSWFAYEQGHLEGDSDRYVVCTGLAVFEALKAVFPLKEKDYVTDRNQVKTSGPLIKKILKDFGEERSYAAEGGRTTRSTRPAAERLVVVLNEITELGVATKVERSAIARTLQKWLFEVGVLPYFNRQKIEVDISIEKPGPQIVADILDMKPNCTRRTIIVSEPTVPTYQPGDYVKVEFPDEATGIGEWMWMRVSRCDDLQQLVFGMLDNEPLNDYGKRIELGSELVVSYSKIREHKKPTEFTRH